MALSVQNFRNKWNALLGRYNKALYLLKKNRLKFTRLLRNYNKLKYLYLKSKKHVNRAKADLIERALAEKYQLVLDHRRRIRQMDSYLLSAIEMTKDEFAASFYMDILFRNFLDCDYTKDHEIAIPCFHFPIMAEHSAQEDEPGVHPFVHLEISGKRIYSRKNGLFVYYLSIKDISPEIELEYFNRTDIMIKRLSTTNNRLQRANKNIEMHKVMLISLVCSLIEEHNKETAEHLQKIRILGELLLQECKRLDLIKPRANYALNDYINDIVYTAVLHDIGKAGVPRELIQKDGPLSPDELSLMRQHPTLGAAYIKKIIDMFKTDPAFAEYTVFLTIPYQICLYHHERWDGRGYPAQLAGQKIPFPARVVSIIDAYDAMRAQRSYNKKKSHQECLTVLREESGRQFDPGLVQAFLNIEALVGGLQYP